MPGISCLGNLPSMYAWPISGIKFSSTQMRTVSRTARSSSERSESMFRKSTPVNGDTAAPVAIGTSGVRKDGLFWPEYNSATRQEALSRPHVCGTRAHGPDSGEFLLAELRCSQGTEILLQLPDVGDSGNHRGHPRHPQNELHRRLSHAASRCGEDRKIRAAALPLMYLGQAARALFREGPSRSSGQQALR